MVCRRDSATTPRETLPAADVSAFDPQGDVRGNQRARGRTDPDVRSTSAARSKCARTGGPIMRRRLRVDPESPRRGRGARTGTAPPGERRRIVLGDDRFRLETPPVRRRLRAQSSAASMRSITNPGPCRKTCCSSRARRAAVGVGRFGMRGVACPQGHLAVERDTRRPWPGIGCRAEAELHDHRATIIRSASRSSRSKDQPVGIVDGALQSTNGIHQVRSAAHVRSSAMPRLRSGRRDAAPATRSNSGASRRTACSRLPLRGSRECRTAGVHERGCADRTSSPSAQAHGAPRLENCRAPERRVGQLRENSGR